MYFFRPLPPPALPIGAHPPPLPRPSVSITATAPTTAVAGSHHHHHHHASANFQRPPPQSQQQQQSPHFYQIQQPQHNGGNTAASAPVEPLPQVSTASARITNGTTGGTATVVTKQSDQAQQQQPTKNSQKNKGTSCKHLKISRNIPKTPVALCHLEKTPMCLINELARFNKTTHQYKLTDESGPAHKKNFTVCLKLDDEEYNAAGPSIKKAQHAAAAIALERTKLRHPPPKERVAKNGQFSCLFFKPMRDFHILLCL
jgi:hypothetical protein